MKNVTLKVDETGDLVFENGMLAEVAGADTTAQNIRMTLKAWKNDFELVPEHGTDYEKVLGRSADEEEAAEIIRDGIYQETEVSQVTALRIKAEGRDMHVSFTGTLKNGTGISMEVDA